MADQSPHIITIERLAYGGAGIGRLDGKVCFVPGTAPGDMVRIRVVADKRSYVEAEVDELITSGADRVIPRCPLVPRCGGCQWQHLSYTAQLRAKEEIFISALNRSIRVPITCCKPILPSPAEFGYRSRIQVKIRQVAEQLVFGFYRTGSHFVVEMPEYGCLVADQRLNEAIRQVRSAFVSFPDPRQIPQLDLSVGDGGGVIAILHYLGNDPDRIASYLQQHREQMPIITGFFLQIGRKDSIRSVYGFSSLHYQVPSLTDDGEPCRLAVSRAGFSQVNLAQNRNLVVTALNFLQPVATDCILDLYCGNGNFSIPLAKSGAMVFGMDDYDGAIRDAVHNASEAGVCIEFQASDAGSAVRDLLARQLRFSAIVLDPPRTGAREVVHLLHDLGAQRIAYVSCDPMTLARDLATLVKNGYEIICTQPIDMFPQTFHLESVTLLKKIS